MKRRGKRNQPARRSRPDGQDGFALLVTLLTIALLTVVVVEFTYSSQVGYRRSANHLRARQAGLLAESGIDIASVILGYDGATTKYDSLDELWAQPLPPIQAGAGLVVLRIEDETARYNLNRLRRPSAGEIQRSSRLLEQAGLDGSLVAALADWIDSDDNPRSFPDGAESRYYANLTHAYTARNAPLRSLGELALVRGFDEQKTAKLALLANVLDRETDKVNVNTASREVLVALHPAMDNAPLMARLMEARLRAPFRNRKDLETRVEGMADIPIYTLLDFKSRHFRVTATGVVDGIYRSVVALLSRDGPRIKRTYWIERRGALIGGVDTSSPTSLKDLPWQAEF